MIAAAAVAQVVRELRPADRPERAASVVRVIELALAVFIVLYALQSLYSRDFETALEQIVFFYVPFALLFKLLANVRWNATLLFRCWRGAGRPGTGVLGDRLLGVRAA